MCTPRLTRREALSLAFMAALAPRSLFATEALSIEGGDHLFVDDFLIAQQAGLERIVVPPTKHPHPIVTSLTDANAGTYVTVLPSERGGFRLWYNLRDREGSTPIGYTESPDGMTWGPHVRLPNPSPINFGASILDRGPAYGAERYLAAYNHGGVCLASSPDGLSWTRGHRCIEGVGDIVTLTWDRARSRYLAIFKTKDVQPRTVSISTSEDCQTWSTPETIIVPDAHDPHGTEFYGVCQPVQAGGLLLAPLRMLNDSVWPGVGHTVLAWSRDGGHTWTRDRTPWLDRTPCDPKDPNRPFDAAMAWASSLVDVGDWTLLYYGGFRTGHKTDKETGRDLGLAWFPRGRFVARRAAGQGVLRTPVVSMAGRRLAVNANVRGSLTVRLLNEYGAPLAGYTSLPITGDAVRHEVLWPAGEVQWRRPVIVEIAMRDAEIYGMTVTE